MDGGSRIETSWGQLRDRFPLLRDVAYFQTGSLAPLADCVRTATLAAFDAEGTTALEGPAAYAEFHQRAEMQRMRLPTFLEFAHRKLAGPQTPQRRFGTRSIP